MSILFAILALLAGIFLSFIIGIGGIIVSVIFAGLAIFFAAKKRKNEGGGGTGSIVISVVAICLSLITFLIWTGLVSMVKDEAKKVDADIVEKAFEHSTWGIIGVVGEVSQDDMDAFKDQLEKVTDSMNKSSESSSSGASDSSSAK